jgi:hypothetical protein
LVRCGFCGDEIERVKIERVKIERVKIERVKIERVKIERVKVERDREGGRGLVAGMERGEGKGNLRLQSFLVGRKPRRM